MSLLLTLATLKLHCSLLSVQAMAQQQRSAEGEPSGSGSSGAPAPRGDVPPPAYEAPQWDGPPTGWAMGREPGDLEERMRQFWIKVPTIACGHGATTQGPLQPGGAADGTPRTLHVSSSNPSFDACMVQPRRIPYSLEVLKNGTIVETHDVSAKGHYTFGRTPACDFTLEHPSTSRLHAVSMFVVVPVVWMAAACGGMRCSVGNRVFDCVAGPWRTWGKWLFPCSKAVLLHHRTAPEPQVLQYNGSTGQAYLYDNASTHGTVVNKQRIKPHVHVPLRWVPA